MTFLNRRFYDNVTTFVDALSGANRIAIDVTKPNGVLTFGISGNVVANNIKVGTGTPEGSVSGVKGDVYQRTDGGVGTTFYIKESGAGNTGWTAVSAGSSGGTSLTGGVAGHAAIWSGTNDISASSLIIEDTNKLILSPNSQDIMLGNNSKFHGSTGVLTIGTTASTINEALEVNGTVRAKRFHSSTASNGLSASNLYIENTNSTSALDVYAMGNSNGGIPGWAQSIVLEASTGGASGGLVFGAYTGDILFQTNARQNSMTLKSNGNLLLNTGIDNGTDKLQVSGSANISGNVVAQNIKRGTGTPEGVVTGDIGDVYQRTDGFSGATIYIKESGTGNTGWTAVAPGSSGGSSLTGGIPGHAAIWSASNSISASNLILDQGSVLRVNGTTLSVSSRPLDQNFDAFIIRDGALANDGHTRLTGSRILYESTDFQDPGVVGPWRAAIGFEIEDPGVYTTSRLTLYTQNDWEEPLIPGIAVVGGESGDSGYIFIKTAEGIPGNHGETVQISGAIVTSEEICSRESIICSGSNPTMQLKRVNNEDFFAEDLRAEFGYSTSTFGGLMPMSGARLMTYTPVPIIIKTDFTGNNSTKSAIFNTTGNLLLRTALDDNVNTLQVSGSASISGNMVSYNIKRGSGTPEGATTGAIGDIYQRTGGSAGTTLYIKEANHGGSTGWTAVASPALYTTRVETAAVSAGLQLTKAAVTTVAAISAGLTPLTTTALVSAGLQLTKAAVTTVAAISAGLSTRIDAISGSSLTGGIANRAAIWSGTNSISASSYITQASDGVVIGTDPGGSETLRVGGDVQISTDINVGAASSNTYTGRFSGNGGTNLVGIGGGASCKIQGFTSGFSATTLAINPLGASVTIGTDPSGSQLVRVGGSMISSGDFTAGVGSAATEIKANGSNSGSNGGGRLSAVVAGNYVISTGNKSSVLGGAYDGTAYFYSNGQLEFSDTILVKDTIIAKSTTTNGMLIADGHTGNVGVLRFRVNGTNASQFYCDAGGTLVFQDLSNATTPLQYTNGNIANGWWNFGNTKAAASPIVGTVVIGDGGTSVSNVAIGAGIVWAGTRFRASQSDTDGASQVYIENNNTGSYFTAAALGGNGHGVTDWPNSLVIEGVPGSTGNLVIGAYSNAIVFQTNARTRAASINANGNIIIGTTTDNTVDKLQVSGSAGISGALVSKNLKRGVGAPEGVVQGNIGDTYQRVDGGTGTSFYIKETGTGNTGWVVVTGTAQSTGGGGDISGTGSDTGVAYFTNSNTIASGSSLRLSNDYGRVLIGPSAADDASSALIVSGNVQLDGYNLFVSTSASTPTDIGTGATGRRIRTYHDAANNRNVIDSLSNAGNTTALHITTSSAPQVVIGSTANASAYKFQVVGKSYLSSTLSVGSTADNGVDVFQVTGSASISGSLAAKQITATSKLVLGGGMTTSDLNPLSSSGTSGEMFYDHTQKSVRVRLEPTTDGETGMNSINVVKCTNIGRKIINNNAGRQALTTCNDALSGAGPLSNGLLGYPFIPYDFWRPGKKVRVASEGCIQVTGTPTLRLRLSVSGSPDDDQFLLMDTNAITMTTITGVRDYDASYTLTCASITSTGANLYVSGRFNYGTTGIARACVNVGLGNMVVAPNKQGVFYLNLSAQFSAASTSNGITANSFEMTQIA